MPIKIEKGISVPKTVRFGKWVNLFKKMKKGDSILVTKKEAGGSIQARKKYKTTQRKVGKDKYRIWKL